jgi:hypothetical protein
MTEEQRTKLMAALQNPEHDRFPFRTARDAAKEIDRLDAARLNAEYQRDTALAELKDANLRLEALKDANLMLEALAKESKRLKRWTDPRDVGVAE